MSEPSSEGGDPACWLDEVCPDCGQIPDGAGEHDCPRAEPDQTDD